MASEIEDEGSGAERGEPASGGVAEPRDWRQHRTAGLLIALAAAAVVGFVVVVNVTHTSTPSGSSASAASAMTGMPVGGAAGTTTSSMGMSSPSASATSSGAVKAATSHGITMVMGRPAVSGSMPSTMPMTPLGQANWDGMVIKPVATAPLPFILINTSASGALTQQVVDPTRKTSFHLMVTLDDAVTGYAIPYSSIWATITKGSGAGGKIILDERLWPMISRFMGPHYGDDVDLPGAGTYRLTLLVSPPAAARHVEYKGLWLQPHRVSFVFHWQPQT